MSDGIIILGAGGHAKVIADIVLTRGERLIGFLDDNTVGKVLGYPILGVISDIYKYKDDCSFIIGIGNNQTRKNIAEKYDVNWKIALHPAAIIAKDAVIGDGTVVMAGVVINSSSKIGKHCIINTSAVVEHDNHIGDYAHISVGAKLAGTVTVGAETWVGIGALLNNNTTVCPQCMIGAGAVVIRDIKEQGTYVGVPVRRIK